MRRFLDQQPGHASKKEAFRATVAVLVHAHGRDYLIYRRQTRLVIRF